MQASTRRATVAGLAWWAAIWLALFVLDPELEGMLFPLAILISHLGLGLGVGRWWALLFPLVFPAVAEAMAHSEFMCSIAGIARQ